LTDVAGARVVSADQGSRQRQGKKELELRLREGKKLRLVRKMEKG